MEELSFSHPEHRHADDTQTLDKRAELETHLLREVSLIRKLLLNQARTTSGATVGDGGDKNSIRKLINDSSDKVKNYC
jgi:hypothetical protein